MKIDWIIIGLICVIITIVIINSNSNTITESFTIVESANPLILNESCEGNDFFIYNYYLVPINVKVITKEGEIGIIATDIMPTCKKGINICTVEKYIKCGSKIEICSDCGIIGESILTIPESTTIRAIHAGQSMSYMDLSVSGDITKSALGGGNNTVPRLRIVNTTPRIVTLTTNGNNRVVIPPGQSHLYLGAWNNEGISLGTVFKDVNGILPPFKLNFPSSDLFIGIISDISLPLFNNTSFTGNRLNDTPGTNFYGLEVDPLLPHKGVLIDNLYIPENW